MQPMDVERKNRLYDNFVAALDHLDAEHREPDRWEEECLSYALGAMACGMFLVAEVELAAFLAADRRALTRCAGSAGVEAGALQQGHAAPWPRLCPAALQSSWRTLSTTCRLRWLPASTTCSR